MNYRHAFHAGGFADVHKHSILVRVLLYLRQKPAAFRAIDTHAGAGRYDLSAPEPRRSGEWRDGVARLWEAGLSGPMADRHLSALVSDQGPQRPGCAGAAAEKTEPFGHVALRVDDGCAADRGWPGRIGCDRGESTVYA